MRNIIALLFILMSPLAHAQVSTGLGLFVHNLNGTTTTDDAKKSLIGTYYFPVQVRYATQPFWAALRWSPYTEFTHITTLLVKNETPDGTAKRNFVIVGSPFTYDVTENSFVSFGPAFMYYELKGNGGTKIVNNGTGTSTFGVPSQTRTSKILMMELGYGWNLNGFRLGTDLFFSGVASQRLATSFQFTFSKTFGGQLW